MKRRWILAFACLFLLDAGAQTNSYKVTTIIDSTQDPYLFNPWGLSRPAKKTKKENEWWVSDNLTGLSTLYYADKNGKSSLAPLVVTIPAAGGSQGLGQPTGTAYHSGAGPGPGKDNFAFATLDGTISNWNAGSRPAQRGTGCARCHETSATLMVDHSPQGASYQGMTVAKNPGTGADAYYVANSNGGVEAYDAASFSQLTLPGGAFTDPQIPGSYTPAGIQAVGANVYVLYNASAGGGTGYVDVFDANGTLESQLQQGWFDQPWGLAQAPANFGAYGGMLLVGNTGSGMIGVYSPASGNFIDYLRDASGQPIVIPGLWGIAFGNGSVDAGPTNVLYFTAGGPDLSSGVFGSIAAN